MGVGIVLSPEDPSEGAAAGVLRRRRLAEAPSAAAGAGGRSPAPSARLVGRRDLVPRQIEEVLEEQLLHREGEPRDVEPRAAAKVAAEEVRIERRRHEHHPKVGAPGEKVPEDDQQEVLVHPPLVDLVHDDVAHTPQQRIARQTAQDDAARAEEKPRVIAPPGLEADLVADHPAELLPALIRHALRDADGADPPRLRADDPAGGPAPRGDLLLEDELRQLRRLAAPRLARDDDHLRRGDGRHELRLLAKRRQLLAELGHALDLGSGEGSLLLEAQALAEGRCRRRREARGLGRGGGAPRLGPPRVGAGGGSAPVGADRGLLGRGLRHGALAVHVPAGALAAA
mmetsp:Transcript_9152/g.22060  ORF Transcript_9152/g.22060 Transcript_9152/m.22060 type:complete len:342 (-) Transcript_9152:737-1762(-)